MEHRRPRNSLQSQRTDPRRIVVVGVCASGKSLLVDSLLALGYNARQCLQEHSYVPDMCERVSEPDVLIFLDATLETISLRRRIDYGESYYREQHRRLSHARRRADLYIQTDDLTADEVLRKTVDFLGCTLAAGPATKTDLGEIEFDSQ